MFTVCFVSLFLILLNKIWNKQGHCLNLADLPNLLHFTLHTFYRQTESFTLVASPSIHNTDIFSFSIYLGVINL